MTARTNPKQESLLVVSEPTGQMAVRNFDPQDGVTVNLIERDLHLMNVLHHLSAASMRDGLVRAGEGVLADRYGNEASRVVLGAERRRQEHMREAKIEFARATGHYALLDSGYDKEEVKTVTRRFFAGFKHKYYGMYNHQANHAYRNQLKQEVVQLSEKTEESVSLFNRRYGFRPHHAESPDMNMHDEAIEDLDKLNVPERLRAVYEDPRAGFLPKNSRELTRVMSWLDYLDNPEKELGIINQLREVFVRAQHPSRRGLPPQKRPGVKGGVRAIESIAWEVGDDLLEATARLHAIRDFSVKINQDQRPDLKLFYEFSTKYQPAADDTLQDLFGENLLALESLVQYQDIVTYMKTGAVPGLDASPLMATEDPPRSVRPKWSVEPGKRKAVLNQYTRRDTLPEYRQHIIQRLEAMSFKQARQIIGECEEDLRQETDFLERRMRDMKGFRSGPVKPLKDALKTIDQQLYRFNAVA